MSTIRFVLRTDKKPGPEYPIELIYQKDGVRGYLRIKEKLRKENWDNETQSAIYLDKKAAKKLLPDIPFDLLPPSRKIESVNAELTRIRQAISKIEQRFGVGLDVEDYSVKDVINLLRPAEKINKHSKFLYDYIDRYIQENKDTRAQGSLSVYKALKKHLYEFQIEKKESVSFDAIDWGFFKRFETFLLTPRKVQVSSPSANLTPKYKMVSLSNSTAAKQLSTIKTFLNYARMQGVKINEGYKDFKISKEDLEVIALTEQEFDTIYNFDLQSKPTLERVRDVFCFACATGLRYSDLAQLKREHIKKDEIRLTVTKTRQPLCIPLNPYSYNILSKYSAQVRPLPVISNQKTNEYLKTVCNMAGLNDPIQIVRHQGAKRIETTYPKSELISVHTGRKTFCTLSLEKGMSAEEVMKISGHKDYKSFARYVNITEKRTKLVMNKAWGDLSAVKLKAV